MAKITEDYVSFEIAKLLKEKGFDNISSIMYKENGEICINPKSTPSWRLKYWYPCLTHQMAMKWLREWGIYITIVYGDYPSLNKVFWTPQIDSLEGFDLPDSFYKEYDEYEQAVEVALKYSLENLI